MKFKVALAASITAAVLSVSTSAYAHRPFSHGILAYGYAPALIADPLVRSGFALAYQVPNLMIYNRYRNGLEQSYHYRWEFVNGAYQWVGYYFEEPWRHHAPRVYSSVPPPHFYHRGHRMPPPPHVGHRPPPPPPGMGHRPPPPPHGMGHRPPPPPPHGMGHKPPPPPPHGLGHKPPPHH